MKDASETSLAVTHCSERIKTRNHQRLTPVTLLGCLLVQLVSQSQDPSRLKGEISSRNTHTQSPVPPFQAEETCTLTCITEYLHHREVFCFFFLFVDRVCPYYLSRSLKQEADVIFMPYNYLVDPKVNQQTLGPLSMKSRRSVRVLDCFY